MKQPASKASRSFSPLSATAESFACAAAQRFLTPCCFRLIRNRARWPNVSENFVLLRPTDSGGNGCVSATTPVFLCPRFSRRCVFVSSVNPFRADYEGELRKEDTSGNSARLAFERVSTIFYDFLSCHATSELYVSTLRARADDATGRMFSPLRRVTD